MNVLGPLHSKPLVLNHEAQYALDQLEHSINHIFISGKAGTGKSTLLQVFRSTSKKRVAVVAPTGVAALNVKGQTIHSFFRFPPRILTSRDIRKAKNRRIYKNLDILIIDEISMVRADMLDNIDNFLRINRDDPTPFGGIRVMFFGDLYQLPPVVASSVERQYLSDRYESPYFFSSNVYQSLKHQIETIELHTVYRQSEAYFIGLLDKIRSNQIDQDILDDINRRVIDPGDLQQGSITLTTRNDVVRRINSTELAKLSTPEYVYAATIEGSFDHRLHPTNMHLILKEGAQVMTVKNDPQRKFVNGSIGKVLKLNPNEIQLEILKPNDENEIIELEKEVWEMIKYKWDGSTGKLDYEVVGSFSQYPVKLAWAITIHKSQGKSFDRVYIDMATGAFEFGQTYVALSRCTNFEGLQLKKPLTYQDVMVDERILEFYNIWR